MTMFQANGDRKGRNSKLETFLRRKLKPGVYGDIRWYEPVVVRRDASLAYKQVVVTGDEILLVDTPPKDISTLVSVNTITAVLMIHDLPEFLEGGLRDRTTHILLKVRSEGTLKDINQKIRRSSVTSSKVSSSRRGSLQSVISEENSTLSLPESVEESSLESYSKAKSPKWKRFLERRCSREILSFSSNDLDKSFIPKKEIQKTGSNKSRPSIIRGITVYDDQETRTRRLSGLGLRGALPLPETRHSIGEVTSDGQIEGLLSPLSGVKTEFSSRPISPALCDVLSRVDSKTFTPNGRSITPDCPPARYQGIPRSASAFEQYQASSSVQTSLRSRSVLDKPLNLQSNTFPRRRRCSSSTLLHMNEFSEEEDEVHLYTLSTSTHLFHLLHSLWMASLLVTSPEMSPCPQLNDEGIEQTFKSLCADLREANTVEDNHSLLQDLRQGIRKYSTVRRFFWRDSECLLLIRRLLRTYSRPKAFELSSSNQNNFERREKELKLVILALEVIEGSLAQSQGCRYKAKTFLSKSLLGELLSEVFAVPQASPSTSLMCKRFLTSFKELSEGSWELLPEKEILQLVQETIEVSTGTAFYLFEAIFEQGWSDLSHTAPKSGQKDVETSSLSVLLQHVAIDEWLSYALPQLLILVQPKSRDVEGLLDRADVVLIYQYLAVLLALLKRSPKALAYCIANYSEEFRYYINESVLKRKFDSLDPLTPHAFRLAKSISKLVLR